MEGIQNYTLVAGAISATVGLLGILWTIFKFINRQKEQDAELAAMKQSIHDQNAFFREELQVLTRGMLAALDGLKQMGANGEVTKTHNDITEHLNRAAHRETEG